MAIETGITLTVYADPDYRFEVEVSDEYSVTYIDGQVDQRINIGFGSLEEMEAVAQAMLKAVKLAKNGY
jgi:hypothetical protein